jgi:hypothetical protein
MTFDGARLDLDDAAELGELLTLLNDWLQGCGAAQSIVDGPRRVSR